MAAADDLPRVEISSRADWRRWLEEHHAKSGSIWLISWKKRHGGRHVSYDDIVEEALCFGWVDSTGGHVDDERGKLYFAPRKPRSVWAASNKARVEILEWIAQAKLPETRSKRVSETAARAAENVRANQWRQ
ncbi:MAG: YdeI/OmpD-associated family protein [Alphaproteobacteria bacterium]|nr:YdeI/OmpD-associated family protein [Alphaproteobacteria bacterium]